MAANSSFLDSPKALLISEDELRTYLDVTQDSNPAHRDSGFAAERGLPNVILPGGLLVTVAERLIREAFPTVALQSFKARFARPTFLGQTLFFHARIARKAGVEGGQKALTLRIKVTSEPDGIMALLDSDIVTS